MARASTPTLIPLDRVPYVTGTHPIHFNGVTSQYIHLEPYCDDVWFQHTWQTANKYSLEDLARDLAAAEEITAKHLQYWPLPNWIVEEEHLLPQYYRTEGISFYNAEGRRKSINTDWKYVLAGGVRGTTVIQAGAAVVYTDPDGDGYNELATVIVATTVTDIEEVRVFYPGEAAALEWEIRPVDVAISGGVATITFQKAQAVLPELLDRQPQPNDPLDAVDGDDDTNFLSTVDVYRVYNDVSQQVVFYVEPSYGCTDGDCDLTEATGCFSIRNSRLGTIAYAPADWDATTLAYVAASIDGVPQRANFWYKAGLQNKRSSYPNLRMVPELEQRIVYYALSIADREIKGCENFQSHLSHKLENKALRGSNREWQLNWDQLRCPLGTTVAAFELWTYIMQHNITGPAGKY